MRTISLKNRKAIDEDPYFRNCARKGPDCDGRITIEHAFIVAGKQLDELWALLPLCTFHHAVNEHQDGGDLNKELNEYLALCRATMPDLIKYPRVAWWQRFTYLHEKFANLSAKHAGFVPRRRTGIHRCWTRDFGAPFIQLTEVVPLLPFLSSVAPQWRCERQG